MSGRPLAIPADLVDTGPLLEAWSWLIPKDDKPLLVGAFGDCIFGAPNGSLWSLSLLEGDYRQIAADKDEYNRLNRLPECQNEWFLADWVAIAAEHGLLPEHDQCLGWKVHPALGAPFEVANIGLFTVRIYQSLTGQLMRQMRQAS